jgi:hypothetical protein
VSYNLYKRLKTIAEIEFRDIVINGDIILTYSGLARKLRLFLIDGTFIDIWYSPEGEYSFHWEQRGIRDSIYRHDNAPHGKWSTLKTFPKHCHIDVDRNVSESFIPDEPEEAMRAFIKIIRDKLFELKAISMTIV